MTEDVGPKPAVTLFDLSGVKPGEAAPMTVGQSPSFVVVEADVVACWSLPNGKLALSLLGFQGRATEMIAHVEDVDGQWIVRGNTIHGGPALMENATVKLSGDTALEAAVGLIRIGLQFESFTAAEVRAKLEGLPLGVVTTAPDNS